MVVVNREEITGDNNRLAKSTVSCIYKREVLNPSAGHLEKFSAENSDHSKAENNKFISFIRADKELRWGGDFKTKDTVHIDDYYNRDMQKWNKLFNEIHNKNN